MRAKTEPNSDLGISEVAVALALPIAAVTFVESLILLFVARWRVSPGAASFMLNHGHWIAAVVIAICCFSICRKGGQGVLAAAAGMAIALFCIFRFRGSHEWYGTFSVYDRNPHFWEFACLIGFVSAAVLGLALSRRTQTSSSWQPIGAAFIGFTALISWLDARTVPSMSLFAPTRHLALFVILTCVMLAFVAQALSERDSNEKKSVYNY